MSDLADTLALNEGSGVVHTWGCGLGPARGGRAEFADWYSPVPRAVLPSVWAPAICTRCLRDEAREAHARQALYRAQREAVSA